MQVVPCSCPAQLLLEICAIKATEDIQGLWVVRHERVHLNMLHILNGGWGLGGFGGVFFALNGKLCKGDCFAKCALQKIFKIVISSHKQQERARIANKTKNSKQKKIANKKIAIVLHAEG